MLPLSKWIAFVFLIWKSLWIKIFVKLINVLNVVMHSGIASPHHCEMWSTELISLTSDHLHTKIDAHHCSQSHYHLDPHSATTMDKSRPLTWHWNEWWVICDGERWRSLLSPMRRPERCLRQTTHVWRHTFHVWRLGLTQGRSGCPLCPAQSISVHEWRNWPKGFSSPRTPLHDTS